MSHLFNNRLDAVVRHSLVLRFYNPLEQVSAENFKHHANICEIISKSKTNTCVNLVKIFNGLLKLFVLLHVSEQLIQCVCFIHKFSEI